MSSDIDPEDPYKGDTKGIFIELIRYLRDDDNDGTVTKSEFADHLDMRYRSVVAKKKLDYFRNLNVIIPCDIKDGEVVYKEPDNPILRRMNSRELANCL